MAIAVTDPSTGEVLQTFDALSDAQVEEALGRASMAYQGYRRTSPAQRARWLSIAADLLDAGKEDLAATMTTEMGKTLVSARAEVTKCAAGLRWYAEHGPALLQRRPMPAQAVGASQAFVEHQPLGAVLAVMPWNFPLWQAVRFAAPTLMAGNVGLLKHASNVPRTALALADVLARAGFPPGVFTTLLVGSGQVEAIVRDPRVVAVTLTGSEAAGRAVAGVAGAALKPSIMELGGSDPFIVMPSADLEAAATAGVAARCLNNGQSCINAKRFFVHADVAQRFTDLFVARMRAQVVGDPREQATDVGPLATESGRADVEAYVADAVAKGATVLCGGQRPDGPGWYYPPTVLTDVDDSMDLWAQEVFGPVAQLVVVADLEEAIELSNAHPYGLGSTLFSEDEDQRARFVAEIGSGMAFVGGTTTSYPELPFGGIKASGYGRELTEAGMYAFMNAKTVWIGPPGTDQAGGDGGESAAAGASSE